MSHKIELPYNIGEKFYSNRIGIAYEHEVLKVNIEVKIDGEVEFTYITRKEVIALTPEEMFKTKEDAVADLVKNIDGLDLEKLISKLSKTNYKVDASVGPVTVFVPDVDIEEKEDDVVDADDDIFRVGDGVRLRDDYIKNMSLGGILDGQGIYFNISMVSEQENDYSIQLEGYGSTIFDTRDFTKVTQ